MSAGRTPTRKIPSSGGGALVASRVLSTTPVKLLGLIVLNTGAAQFLQVHETTTLPADEAVPVLPSIPVAANGVTMFSFGDWGVDLDALTVCNSSTAATKTIGAANCAIVGIVQG
jgi:hypothetical protein